MYLAYLPAALLFLFALLNAALWLLDRARNRHMAWIALGFGGIGAAMAVQVYWLPPQPPLNAVGSGILYTAGTAFFVAGVLQRARLEGAALPLAAMALALVGYMVAFSFGHNDLVMRAYGLNFGMGIIAAYGLWRLRASLRGALPDRLLFWILACFCAQSFLRPLLTAGSIGNPTQLGFANSLFWVATSYVTALFSVAIGVALLFVSGLDALTTLRRDSDTDPLTGTDNRRGLESRAARLLARAANRPVALIICDIDHFKAVNDRFGHAAGDLLLRSFAATLRQNLRPDDLLARLGGEEFLVLAARTDAAAGYQLAERMRRAVAAADLGGFAGGNAITCSLGVVEMLPGEQLWDAMRRADKLLYAAKNAGRDRTHADIDMPPAEPDSARPASATIIPIRAGGPR